MFKRKHIDAAREVRLWVKEIGIPLFVGMVAIDSKYPDLKHKAKSKMVDIYNRIKSLI